MQFNQAGGNTFGYDKIKELFNKKGFKKIPTIVFWNLRADTNNFAMDSQ